MKRGEIWWANLPKPVGSGPGYKRPVLVIQADAFNRSKINTVIALVITSNLLLAQAPGNLLLAKKHSGLPKKSVINVSQMMTLDRVFLTKKEKQLNAQLMEKIDEGIRLVLSV